MSDRRRIVHIGIIYLLPALVLITMFSIVPFVWNMILSFQKWNGFGAPQNIGLANYIYVLKNQLTQRALTNSVLYAFASTAGGLLFGLLFATLIFRLPAKEGGIFRLILYSPAMLPTAVVGIMFVFFFNPEMGLLNNFLRLIGLNSLTHVWLQDRSTAMACIIFVAIWKCSGSIMMLTFAAIQSVPASLYESSYMDGATFRQQMTQIVLPLIKPTILLATINTLGGQFKSYDLIFTMTQGGPADLTTTVPIVMKKTAFIFGSFGSAASMGALFTIVVAASILLVRLILRGDSYEY